MNDIPENLEVVSNGANKKIKTPKTANFKHTFEVLAVFLFGMIVSAALLFGAYYVMINKDLYLARQQASNSSSAQTQTDQGKQSVTDEELGKYVDMKDCSTDPRFSNLKISTNRLKMQSINLDAGTIMLGTGSSGTGPYSWKELPKVVDSKCEVIKLTDIKSGDILNTYIVSATSDVNSYIALIQKAV